MPIREAAAVGGGAARRRETPAGSRPETRQRRMVPLRERSADERWTARRSVLVAISGACVLWSVLFGALTLIGG